MATIETSYWQDSVITRTTGCDLIGGQKLRIFTSHNLISTPKLGGKKKKKITPNHLHHVT